MTRLNIPLPIPFFANFSHLLFLSTIPLAVNHIPSHCLQLHSTPSHLFVYYVYLTGFYFSQILHISSSRARRHVYLICGKQNVCHAVCFDHHLWSLSFPVSVITLETLLAFCSIPLLILRLSLLLWFYYICIMLVHVAFHHFFECLFSFFCSDSIAMSWHDRFVHIKI